MHAQNRVDGLYIVLISMHGLIRGQHMELGRDADTGGQVTTPTLSEMQKPDEPAPGIACSFVDVDDGMCWLAVNSEMCAMLMSTDALMCVLQQESVMFSFSVLAGQVRGGAGACHRDAPCRAPCGPADSAGEGPKGKLPEGSQSRESPSPHN